MLNCFGSFRLDICVSVVSQVSNIFSVSQSRLVLTKSEMSWLVSCLDTSVLFTALTNVSVSEKNVSTPSLWDTAITDFLPDALTFST